MPHPRGYVCRRVKGRLSLNGKLDDPAWKSAPWTADFVDIEGDAKPKPRFRTRAKMIWDDEYFYVGADLVEPHVWGTLTKRDSVIFHDNDFEVFIDPDGDNHQYYEIEINALNTVWDLRLVKPYRDGGPALNEWDIPGLRTAVHVDGTLNDPRDMDRGWSLEMAFPWKVLAEFANCPCPPREGDQWRINFSRVEWLHEVVEGKYRKVAGKKEDNWVWSPQGAIDMHRPEKWGYVQFTSDRASFRADASLPARDRLVETYHAQRRFKEKHNRWASTPAELGIAPTPTAVSLQPPIIRSTNSGYVASVELRLPGGARQVWHISEDSRLWEESRP